MAYLVGKPAHNRLTLERVQEECSRRNHILLSFEHPILKVRCHCGNEYEQKIHSYRAAKNSCKKCDSARKSRPRPEHSVRMTGDNNPAKRAEVRQKISEKVRGPRPHLIGTKKNWKPGVLEKRSKWMSEKRADGTIISPGNLGSAWIPTSEQRLLPGTLYLVNYRDEDGDHIKIGITKRTVEERLGSKLVSVITTREATLGECFDLEQDFLSHFSEFRYSSSTTTELIQMDQFTNAIEYLRKHK